MTSPHKTPAPLPAMEAEAAQRIFEVMCGGPVDWAKHAADTSEDNLFQSADWECCLAYAKAALAILPAATLTTSQPVELAEICKELGCTTEPGVALRFVKELRRDFVRAHERQVELLQSWDLATPTERQELYLLRRGWGPSTPTERMARRADLREANSVIERAMDAVAPDSKADEDLTVDHFQSAYEKLSEGHRGTHRAPSCDPCFAGS